MNAEIINLKLNTETTRCLDPPPPLTSSMLKYSFQLIDMCVTVNLIKIQFFSSISISTFFKRLNDVFRAETFYVEMF